MIPSGWWHSINGVFHSRRLGKSEYMCSENYPDLHRGPVIAISIFQIPATDDSTTICDECLAAVVAYHITWGSHHE